MEQRFIPNNIGLEILTPTGFQKFDGIRKTSKRGFRFYFDKEFVDVSYDHKFIVDDDEEIIASELNTGDLVNHKSGKIKISKIEDIGIIEVYDPVNVDGNNLYYGNDVVHHNCRFVGSTNTVISAECIRTLLSQYKNPKFYDLEDKLRLWEKPLEGARYVMGCLPPNEKVLTDNGIKSIKNVLLTDKLIDKEGKLTSIKNIQIYKNIKDYIYDISVYGSYRSTKFTSEHPLYVSENPQLKRKHGESRYRDFDFKFKEVKDITTKDWIRYPNIYKDKDLSDDDLKNKINQYSSITRKDFSINEDLILDKDFWWFIGCWLGDGWIQNYKNSYSIHTCHDIKSEYYFAEKVKNLFEKYNRSVVIFNKGSCVNTVFSSKQLHMFLEDNFGKYSHGKYISEWVKYIPEKYKLELIKGYIDSDGCLYENDKRKNSNFNISSVSLELLEGMQDILYSLGCISSLQKKKRHTCIIGKKESKCRKKYSLILSNYDSNIISPLIGYECKYKSQKNRNKRYCYFSNDKKYIYFKIKKIEKTQYEGDVYNFETDSHEFLCRNITTHNCDPAKGTGENYSTIQILKINSVSPIDMEQVAVFQDNYTDVFKFSAIVNRLSYYYNDAYIMAENNSEGSSVIGQLWWNYENENLVNSGSKEANLGIRANKNTKPKAVLLMKKIIEDGSVTLHDKETIEELGSFIEENNKFFGKDKPDDLVSALYWACYLYNMNILDDDWKFAKDADESDAWGILSDIEYDIDDWSWLDSTVWD